MELDAWKDYLWMTNLVLVFHSLPFKLAILPSKSKDNMDKMTGELCHIAVPRNEMRNENVCTKQQSGLNLISYTGKIQFKVLTTLPLKFQDF